MSHATRIPAPNPAVFAGAGSTLPFVLITGGSEGIGLALARAFAVRGRNLLLTARHLAPLTEAQSHLRSIARGRVEILTLDLLAPDAISTIDAELDRIGGHIELLVNNAGQGLSGPFIEAVPEDIDALSRLNFTVPLILMRHVLPGMIDRRSGGIINVSSLGGYVPGPYQAAYYASKAALSSASRAIAAEVRGYGITVTAVAPGPVATRFHAKMDAESAFYRRFLPAARPEIVARLAVLGHELGLRAVFPGLVSILGYVCCRVLPDALLVPIMAALLKPRHTTQRGEG